MTTSAEERDEVMEVAAYWAMRLSSDDCTPADRAAFEKWRRENPAHDDAFRNVDEAMGAVYRNIDDADLIAYAAEVTAEPSAPNRLGWRRFFAGGAVAASLALAVFVGLLLTSFGEDVSTPTQVVYHTEIGERSTTILADGSEITLNTNTTLNVDYSDAERRLELVRGQVFFKVAKDTTRPFVVVAGDNRIVATGTEFDVRFDVGEKVAVTLVEGEVIVDGAVSTADPAGGRGYGAPIIMTPGQQMIATVDATPALVQTDVARVVSWSEGRLVFENDLLADAVAEMNRYTERPIVLEDDERLEAILVGGVFQTGRQDSFLLALQTIHPVDVIERPDRALLMWRE